jgi:hypothetical protein
MWGGCYGPARLCQTHPAARRKPELIGSAIATGTTQLGGMSVTTTEDHSAGARAWLNSSATRTASDAALGCILAIAGAFPIWDAGGLSFGEFLHFEAKLFPSAVGVAILAVGVLLLARAALVRRPPPASWGVRNIVIVAALFIASRNWGMELMLLNFGPPEHVATLVLILVTLCALACRSHLQAVGLVLLGLLLGAVGLDSITGQLRLTMGLEQLYSGLATPLVATGLLVVADGLIGLMSPSLWVATYGWIRPAWRNVRVPLAAAIVLRIVAVLAVAAGCYFGFLYGGRGWDVALFSHLECSAWPASCSAGTGWCWSWAVSTATPSNRPSDRRSS